MAWFIRNAVALVFSLATLLSEVHTCQLNEERNSGIHLAYECVNVHSSREEGVPVIMLHGLSDMKETWDGIYQNIPLLTRRRVCIYDARNHGDSAWNDTFDVDVLAEDLENFMRDRKIEKAALVGHSMGGLTVMKFALKNPSKVESVFVEDISPVGIPKDVVTAIQFYLRLLGKSVEAVPGDADEDTVQKTVMDYVTKAISESPYDMALNDLHLFKRFPFRRQNGVWQWKANFDVFIKAFEDGDSFLGKMEGQYDGKMFLIYGTNSTVFKIDDKDAIRKLFPKAEFFAVEGADHVIHNQHREFLDELVKFLKGKVEQSEL